MDGWTAHTMFLLPFTMASHSFIHKWTHTFIHTVGWCRTIGIIAAHLPFCWANVAGEMKNNKKKRQQIKENVKFQDGKMFSWNGAPWADTVRFVTAQLNAQLAHLHVFNSLKRIWIGFLNHCMFLLFPAIILQQGDTLVMFSHPGVVLCRSLWD